VIFKPFKPFANDYYYYKSGGYNVIAQAMVDCNKQFIDLFLGLYGSMNDSWVLQKYSFYNKTMYQNLLHLD
jgi:hypothetical protein